MTRGVSQTALLVAGLRADLTDEGRGLCDDPWAAALAGEDGREVARRALAVNPPLRLWLEVRTWWFDRMVRRLLPAAPQLVVLGAGLDSRAVRLAGQGVATFEVDTPATQAEKRRRVAAVAGYPDDAVTYVATDFEHDGDITARLLDAGFDPQRPAVVVWEGVTYYLDDASIVATLRELAIGLHPDSTVLFDHVEARLVAGATSGATDAPTLDLVADLGEPFRWGSNHVVPLLAAHGYRHVLEMSFDEAALAATGTYERDRAFRFQHLVAASVGREQW